jgi:hypothetical protein
MRSCSEEGRNQQRNGRWRRAGARTNFELPLVEYVDELLGDELVETAHERLELLLDSLGDSVLGDGAGKNSANGCQPSRLAV